MTHSSLLRPLALALCLFAPLVASHAAQAVPQKAQTPAQLTPQQPAVNPKVQQLINQAQASYNSGVDNYRANHLDAARVDFDYAIDLMLASGQDLTGDSPLADEFNRLVDAINSLEIAALRQGNGLTPKVEAAPLDVANDETFAPNPELVAKLKTELNITSDLPLIINDQVAGYIGIFSNSTSFRAHMAASLRRLGRYRTMMTSILAQEGLPQDLIYLSVAESGFQPQALNARSGAGGMWQFMPTGAYGLARTGYFDERFDPEKSTRAYARYIKALYNQFGDWYLAMAAYDWGPGNIQRVVQRTGYADFWELYRRNAMPAETRAYVPEILAAVIMAKNPERYGLDKLTLDPPVLYDTVTVHYAIDLRLVADVTQVSVPEIVALNPSLLRLATPADTPFDLHIPAGTKDLFAARLKDIPESRRASWRFHIVKEGETLAGIGSSLHARPQEIAETNGITEKDPMAVGDELVVPVVTVAAARSPQRYTIRRGDTLVSIADRFNISLEDLRRWNTINPATFRAGRSLNVAEPVRLAPSMRSRTAVARVRQRSAARSYGRSTARGRTVLSPRSARSARPSSSRAASSASRLPAGRKPATKRKATH
jgi:membrane-bound lytic murein transglycosylase D